MHVQASDAAANANTDSGKAPRTGGSPGAVVHAEVTLSEPVISNEVAALNTPTGTFTFSYNNLAVS